MMKSGTIIKGIGGFYYVEAAGDLYECKARGVFRKRKLTPMVGDHVVISVKEDAENTIEEIMDRKNSLVRPPLANIDRLFIISSVCKPNPSLYVIDKLIMTAESKSIEPVILFSKTDLKDAEDLIRIYRNAGFESFAISKDGEGIEKLRGLLKGKTSAFTGNSGVGKSTILNLLDGGLALQTAEISEKLGRGRHTTRHCELFRVCGGYVADTPGFTSLEQESPKSEVILKEDLQYMFREFEPYLFQCKFTSCAHVKEQGCKILEAVTDGRIEKTRHESYVQLYHEVKNLKEWNLK